MATLNRTVICVVVDIVSIFLAFVPTIVTKFGHVEPFQRGFYCDDESIKYPYRDDTVPWWSVPVVGLSIPIISIIAIESVHHFHKRDREKYPCSDDGRCDLPKYVVLSYRLIGLFLFGCGVTLAVSDICKFSIGRLRPHFFDVCRPNITTSTSCDNPSSGLGVYVDNFTCTGLRTSLYHDSRLSFLSGHASISYYCAIFFALYIQSRLTWTGSKLFKHLLQACAIYVAVYVGLSRVSDYKHHWSDVLMGAILGTIIAALVGYNASKLFPRCTDRKCEDCKSRSHNGDPDQRSLYEIDHEPIA